MAGGKIGVVEVFRSVQGEGRNAGRMAIFVRLAGCNLSCVFAEGVYCDTPYMKVAEKYGLAELFDEVIYPMLPGGYMALRGNSSPETAPMLILTGGEPTISPRFDDIVRQAYRMGFYTAVETNGTNWRDSMRLLDWITVSPKDQIEQGSPAEYHNKNPQDPTLDEKVVHHMSKDRGGEYRFVIGGPGDPIPRYLPAERHYVSPAIISDGSGGLWKHGFPGFAKGALERCIEIVTMDPRWRISLQSHKFMGVR